MAETQKIDPKRVEDAGNRIKEIAESMFKTLDTAKTHVVETKSYFKSEGGDAIRDNFVESAKKFDSFRKFINEYGEYLISYAKMVRDINTQIEASGKKIPKLG